MKKSIYIYLYISLTISLNGQVINNQELDKGTSIQRNTLFNLDEIKVRWKKAALDNCPGVPCTPFTCGSSMLMDVDGNVYTTIAMGTQCWTKENLKVTRYNDGTSIPLDASGTSTGTVSQTWSARNEGAYTIYENEAGTGTNATNYGYLYNWYAANGIIEVGGSTVKNICPSGWHVPTDEEWTTLIQYLDNTALATPSTVYQSLTAGGQMKSTSSLWLSPSILDNSSGFSGLPAGYRNSTGSFLNARFLAFFWSAGWDSVNNSISLGRWLNFINSYVYRDHTAFVFTAKTGASVRCLKN